jgi:hypothetical protein
LRYDSNVRSDEFEQAAAAYDAVAAHLGARTENWSTGERLAQLERVETLRRILPALEHELINQLAADASREELGGKLSHALADRLRIDRDEAGRRIHEAADLGPRRALTGEPLEPKLAATAAAQQHGLINGEHVQIIRGFLDRLPDAVDVATREQAERDLAGYAAQFRPDQLRGLAVQLELCLNPDGNYSDADRARRRGIIIGAQGIDGMSKISGLLTPELRAGLEAVIAKWGAPGMCNPEDETPTIKGTPCQTAIDGDRRSGAQRAHDALNAMTRNLLMSGELGSHHGLPVTIVATATLEDLQAKTGVGHTGGGTVLPISDIIRMAAHSYNYLLLFDNAKRCELYKGRESRLATKEQRLVLYATERGCSRPGCIVPAYWCQVHHATKDWADGGQTNIDELTLACGPDNRLVKEGGWQTRKRKDARTEWIPPPHLDRGQPRTNTFHHPERLLKPDENDSG